MRSPNKRSLIAKWRIIEMERRRYPERRNQLLSWLRIALQSSRVVSFSAAC
jgi:hypothetical protein